MIKERRGKVNQHTPGFAAAIYTSWDQEIEPKVMQEDKHDGIL